MTDTNGAVNKNYLYDAFGVEKNKDENDVNPFRYCGEYFDRETGTIYLRARYYNPNNGRFSSEDIIRNGLNWYTYCGGSPISFVDPLGLLSQAAQQMYDYYTKVGTQQASIYNNAKTPKEREKALTDLMKTFDLMDDVKAKDKQGLVTGKTLNVPSYAQQDYISGDGRYLCGQTASAMYLSYRLGDNKNRKIEIARALGVTGNGNDKLDSRAFLDMKTVEYMKKKYKIDVEITIPSEPILTQEEIKDNIDAGNPFGAQYIDLLSHVVVGIGYTTAPGHDFLVIYNDPWTGGVDSMIKTYEEFQYNNGGKWGFTILTSY